MNNKNPPPVSTVVLNSGGRELEVNPRLICSIMTNEMKPDRSTIVNMFGHCERVVGSVAEIRAALGWQPTVRIGFREIHESEKLAPAGPPEEKGAKEPAGPSGNNGKVKPK